MTDKEKVIKGLVCCANFAGCAECPYDSLNAPECYQTCERDALELLKEREPIEPKEVKLYPHTIYACGGCGHMSVGSNDYHAKFCPECGRGVKWDD